MRIEASLLRQDFESARSKPTTGKRISEAVFQIGGLLIFLAVVSPGALKFAGSASGALRRQQWSLLTNPVMLIVFAIGLLLLVFVGKIVLVYLRSIVVLARPAGTEAAKTELRAGDDLGAHVYDLEPDGIRIISAMDASWYHWSAFRFCRETPRAIRIFFDKKNWLVLPKSALPDDGKKSSVLSTIATAVASQPAATSQPGSRIAPLADPIFQLVGTMTRRDLMDLHDWRSDLQAGTGLASVLRISRNPFFAIPCALTCGLGGLFWWINSIGDVLSGELQWADVRLAILFQAIFAAVLVVGLLGTVARLARRTSGLALGLKLGPKDFRWGDTRIDVSEAALMRTTGLAALSRVWQSYSALAETKKHFIVWGSPRNAFLIPKRFFADETARQKFRNLAARELENSARSPA